MRPYEGYQLMGGVSKKAVHEFEALLCKVEERGRCSGGGDGFCWLIARVPRLMLRCEVCPLLGRAVDLGQGRSLSRLSAPLRAALAASFLPGCAPREDFLRQ